MTARPTCSFVDELDSLCTKVEEKATKDFEDTVKNCNIDLNKNKELASEYYSLVKSNNKLEKQIRRLKVWRWVLIIFLIFPFFLMTNAMKKKQALLDSGESQENKAKRELDAQLAYFIPKISYDLMYKKVIEPLWPDVKIDIYQDEPSYKVWNSVIGNILPKDACFTTLLSGHIFNNPFMMYNFKKQEWTTATYTGSVPVTYTEHIDGKTVVRTEIVVASETLPAPYWARGTELAYYFDRAEKLCFTNNVSKGQFKKWNKKEQLPMENSKFDKLFACIRNDEKDYRVLFTPLAQENFVKLFGECKFIVEKNEEVTLVQLDKSGNPYLDVTPNEAFNYDLNVWKTNYANWTKRFVRDLGLLTLPIANIPVYTQFDVNESLIKNKGIASNLQVEDNLAHIFDVFDMWDNFDTDVIFQPVGTSSVTIGGVKFSKTDVRCNYFYPEHKTIVKTVMSIHKGLVPVPINIINYIPRHKVFSVYQSANLDCSTKESIIGGNMIMHRGQLMFIGSNKISEKQIEDIKNSFKNKKKD